MGASDIARRLREAATECASRGENHYDTVDGEPIPGTGDAHLMLTAVVLTEAAAALDAQAAEIETLRAALEALSAMERERLCNAPLFSKRSVADQLALVRQAEAALAGAGGKS